MGVSCAWLVCVCALAETTLRSIADSVRAGEDRQALAAMAELPPNVRQDAEVRYLEGRLLLDQGRPCDAMEALENRPASLPEAMRNDALRRWAIAAGRCGECETARPVLLSLESDSATEARRDRVLAADCAIQLGQLETAAEELERLTSRGKERPGQVPLWTQLTALYLELDRPDEAREAALRGWTAAVLPGQRANAVELEALASPGLADQLDRADAFMRARMFGDAAALLETLDLDREPQLEERWLHLYGMSLFRTRTRYAEAAKVLSRSAALGGSHSVEDEFHAARALSRADEDAKAIRAYRKFARAHPRSSLAPEARFLAAWLEIRLGRASGEQQMARLLRGKQAVRGKWRRSALWELGFRAVEKKRTGHAVRYLTEYTKLTTSAMDQARGYYWLGRAYRRGPSAVDAYRQAIGVEPLHWYAVLAAARLQQLGVEPPPPFEPTESEDGAAAEVEPPPLPRTFETYRSLGLDADAVRWLSAHEDELVAEYPKSMRLPALAILYDDVGAYRDALQIARRRMAYLHTDPEQNRWWWNAAYPMPWRDVVDAHCGSLPPALIYATMRQESGYVPDVVSRAGAVGLMQVMPDVASRIAGEAVTPRMLTVPARNIPLGLEEMKALADKYDDVYPLSIAAYNAGRHRVDRWLRESGRMELDRFVERIPFNETRNYVRRVMTHYARYEYLDDADAGWPTLPRFVKP